MRSPRVCLATASAMTTSGMTEKKPDWGPWYSRLLSHSPVRCLSFAPSWLNRRIPAWPMVGCKRS